MVLVALKLSVHDAVAHAEAILQSFESTELNEWFEPMYFGSGITVIGNEFDECPPHLFHFEFQQQSPKQNKKYEKIN